jgi:lambda family phage tail tape measure protein
LAATIPAIVKATAERNKMRGFADGGYTGEGSKYTPAGIVHKGEVVFSKEDVKLLGGVKKTDSLRPTSNANMQYFTGGIVGFGNTSTAKNETNYAMVEAVKNLQIVATIEDINAGLSSEQNRISISRI